VFCSYDASVSERADTVSISFSCTASDIALHVVQQWLSRLSCFCVLTQACVRSLGVSRLYFARAP
jgi:hypothetical protein